MHPPFDIVRGVPPVPRVLLAAESLQPRASGIGRVARLTARVLAERARRGEVQFRALALNDEAPATDLDTSITACRGSRVRFVLECQRAALDCTHFIYDFAGMARAHPFWARPKRPSLVWVHGMEVWEQALHERPDRLRTLARATVLVTNTAYTRARASRLHGGMFDRAIPCWLGTETDDVPSDSPAPEPAANNLLLLGRMDPIHGQKGHRELIACWPRVVDAVPNARLLFAGGGDDEPNVRSLAASSPVRDRIELLGFVPESQIAALWSRAVLYAMPAQSEGLGLAYIEAMRHGLPVIASVHDAAPEINLHGLTGYNVDLKQPGELENRVIELLLDPALRDRMGAAGRERWWAHFRYSAFRDRLRPILDDFFTRG
jgi:phosphatidylinositol alpha-1,6-mannosyltransferase